MRSLLATAERDAISFGYQAKQIHCGYALLLWNASTYSGSESSTDIPSWLSCLEIFQTASLLVIGFRP
jgi:hypothetical protein